jgi:hypothetical protein
MTRRCLFAAVLFLSAAAVPAATPVLLIGPELRPQRVMLQSFGPEQVSFFDADRTLQFAAIDEFQRLRVLGEAEASADAAALGLGAFRQADAPLVLRPIDAPGQGGAALLVLTDGQRLIGRIGPDSNQDRLHWRHELLGDVRVALEHVRAVAFDPGATMPSAGTGAADRLLLANNDVLGGFVVAVRPSGVEFQPTGQPTAVVLPPDRVKLVQLANPMRDAMKEPGHVVHLRDGTTLRAARLEMSDDVLTAVPALASDQRVQLSMAHVARIDLDSRIGRLIDLADVPLRVTDGGEVFGTPMPPRVTGGDIWVHAPVTIEFAFGPQTRRIAAELALAGEDGQAARISPWSSMTVSVEVDGAAVAQHELTAKSPTALLNVKGGQRVTLRFEPAQNGPVFDGAWVRSGVVFIEK